MCRAGTRRAPPAGMLTPDQVARLAGLAHEDRVAVLASLHHNPPKRPEPPRVVSRAELLPELLPDPPKRPEPRRRRLRSPGRLSVWLPDE